LAVTLTRMISDFPEPLFTAFTLLATPRWSFDATPAQLCQNRPASAESACRT